MYMYEFSESADAQLIACGAALSLIDAHPESEATSAALSYFIIHCDQIGKTRADLRATLLTIVQEHPGTRIATQASNALKTYKANE